MRAVLSAPARVAAVLIRGYQRGVSPLLPASCRYWPPCSEYARQAIIQRGLILGGVAAASRLLRCQPLFPGGIDPPR